MGNDPVNMRDPTGKYGRGEGWNEKDWKKFDKAQQKAANRMEKRADKLEAKANKLDAKGKEGGDNLRTAAGNLRGGASALRSDGSDGKLAYAGSANSGTWTRGQDVAAFVDKVGGNTMVVNLDHNGFKAGGVDFQKIVTHESLHTAGLSDTNIWGIKSYCCSGNPTYLQNYNSLTPDQSVLNPDYLMNLVY